jgi:uncharacterized pyridoxal phosphate-containing UPF0001 family protein
VTWHFIGPVQRNKVNALAPWVAWWHTVDRPALVTALGTHVSGAAVLLEVNLAGEPQKAGCEPGSVARLADSARAAGLDVVGLMAIPPHPGTRRWFSALADLAATKRASRRWHERGLRSGDREGATTSGWVGLRPRV